MPTLKSIKVLVFLGALAGNLASAGKLGAQGEPFYKGKTVRIVVGLTGGFYDRWARLLARFMPLYIPGNPNFVVQNMPGGGSMIAMNHIYRVAKPDGLTLGMPNYGVYLDQLAGRAEVHFDITKMHYTAPRRKAISCFTRAPTRRSSRSRTCANFPSRPSAARAAPPARTI